MKSLKKRQSDKGDGAVPPRYMSWRRLNAKRRLEEWRTGEEERRLEKKAEEFLKKIAKKGKRGVGDGAVEKYVAKCIEDLERCALGFWARWRSPLKEIAREILPKLSS